MSKLADAIRKVRHNFCSVVVVAAGSSQRMGQDKLMLEVDGKPVIALTLMALNASAAVDEIVVVTRPEKLEQMGRIVEGYNIDKVTKIVIGGENRTQSALAGVSETDPKAKVICIHDGARPFVTDEIISEVVHQAVLNHAACPAIPVKDTIRIAEDGVAVQTPDRSCVFAVQTPQGFTADIIKAALTAAVRDGKSYTDDCAAAEALGVKVYLTRGSGDNIKITTPLDLALAESIAKERRILI